MYHTSSYATGEDKAYHSSPSFRTPSRAQYSGRRIVRSPDVSDGSEAEVIELTDSSDEDDIAVKRAHITLNANLERSSDPAPSSPSPSLVPPHTTVVDDGAIIVFDEPKIARTPLRKSKLNIPSLEPEDAAFSSPTQANATNTATAKTPYKKPAKKSAPSATPRTSKKAQLAQQRERLHTYAQLLFSDLNTIVFGGALPETTQLNWNNRLVSTAGRAKWHRSRDGVETTQIELADKILDSEERIRHTLSHEMCHLATWVIDKKLNEHHGPLFKSWANKLMKKRPDIHVSIKHDYEITYPFEWKCEKCAKIYGRFSKSIKPEECLCGACREGRLIPLFKTRQQTKTPQKISQLAASKPQDSPRTNKLMDANDPNSDVEVLRILMEATDIAGSKGASNV
ncbi:SprT-like family-domain-containing protein [Panaeolus papilionaceus]|nr:SprT-like family-domain-containing protein [Panaeolus papilionaceus]